MNNLQGIARAGENDPDYSTGQRLRKGVNRFDFRAKSSDVGEMWTMKDLVPLTTAIVVMGLAVWVLHYILDWWW